MAYIIDETFFTRELQIPGIEDAGRSLADLNMFIDDKVRRLLRLLLGDDLFFDLDSNIDQGTGMLKVDASQKWLDFVNGKSYVDENGNNKEWFGLLRSEGSFKTSFLAYYVYYFWLKNQISYVSAVGEVQVMAKNAVSVNSKQRLVDVWNKFVKEFQGGRCFNYPYYPVYFYNGVISPSWNYNTWVYVDEYLAAFPLEYPNIKPLLFEIKNQLGL